MTLPERRARTSTQFFFYMSQSPKKKNTHQHAILFENIESDSPRKKSTHQQTIFFWEYRESLSQQEEHAPARNSFSTFCRFDSHFVVLTCILSFRYVFCRVTSLLAKRPGRSLMNRIESIYLDAITQKVLVLLTHFPKWDRMDPWRNEGKIHNRNLYTSGPIDPTTQSKR